MAKAFGAPVMIGATFRGSSRRVYAAECEMPMLIIEAGEALRFAEPRICDGLRGATSVIRSIGMRPTATKVQESIGSAVGQYIYLD